MDPRDNDIEKAGERFDPSHDEGRRSQGSLAANSGSPSEKHRGTFPPQTSKAPIPDNASPSVDLFPPHLLAPEQYLVQFDGPKDPLQALNWRVGKK